MPDHYSAAAAFLPADIRATVNAAIPGHLSPTGVRMARAARAREARSHPPEPAVVEIVLTADVLREVGIGWAEETLAFDLAYTARHKDVAEGGAQADRASDVLRALRDRYHLKSDLGVAALVRAEVGPAVPDQTPASSEQLRAVLPLALVFLTELPENAP